MIEILKPAAVIADTFALTMANISQTAARNIERRDKNLPSEYWVAHWDETKHEEPTEAEMIASQDAVILAQAKEAKQANLDAGYESAEGVPVNVSGVDFDASANALAELNSVVIFLLDGNALPPNFSWVDVNGIERDATEPQIKALQYEVGKKHYQDVHKYARLTNLVKAATTVAEVNAIPDW